MDRPRSFIPSRDLKPTDWQQMHAGFSEAQRDGKYTSTWTLVNWAPSLAIMFSENKPQLALSDIHLSRIADHTIVQPPTKNHRHRALETVRLLRPDRFNDLIMTTGARPFELDQELNWKSLNIEARRGGGLDQLSAIRAAVISFPERGLEETEEAWKTTTRLIEEYSQPRQIEDTTLPSSWSNVMEAIATAKLAFPERAGQLPSIPQDGWDRLFRNIDRARLSDVSEDNDWLLLAPTLTAAAIISSRAITKSEHGIHLAF